MYHYNSTIHTWCREQDSILISFVGEPVSRHLNMTGIDIVDCFIREYLCNVKF